MEYFIRFASGQFYYAVATSDGSTAFGDSVLWVWPTRYLEQGGGWF